MSVINPPTYLQSNTVNHPARNFRIAIGAGFVGQSGLNVPRSGVVVGKGGELAVVQTGGGAMSVTVNAGIAVVNTGSFSNHHGAWVCGTDSTPTVITIATADTTNPRIDLIVAKVEDSEYTGSANTWSLAAVTGTPGGTPSPPAAPVNSITLAEVSVPANDTSITNSQITDKRLFTSAAGGVLPVLSTGKPSTPGKGQPIFETDTGKIFAWDGTTWQQILVARTGNDFDGALALGGDLTVTGNLSVTGIGTRLFARKPNSESIANTTMQNDDDLFLSVAANAVYEMTMNLSVDGGSDGDINVGFSGPSGAILEATLAGLTTSATGGANVQIYNFELSTELPFGTTGVTEHRPITAQGLLVTAGTSGTFRLRWAQNTSSASSTRVLANSFLSLVRVA